MTLLRGGAYAAQIVHAIKECSVLVLIFSKYVNESEHVGNEIDRAFNANKPIIPFVIENTEINEELDYYLSRKHWLVALSKLQRENSGFGSNNNAFTGKK